MITFRLTDNKKYIELIDYDKDEEYKRVRKHFRKQNDGYFFSPRYKNGVWDGYDNLLRGNKHLGSGLWVELVKACKENGIKFDLQGLHNISNFKIDIDELNKFIAAMIEGTSIEELRDYQYNAIKLLLQFMYGCVEIATSGGKTITLFIVAKYLKWKRLVSKDKKMIAIVPKTDLALQTYNKFVGEYNNGKIPMNICVFGGKKNPFDQHLFDESELIITTYQSLRMRTREDLRHVRHIVVDESHTSKGDAITNIIMKCPTLISRMGMSGTLDIKKNFSTAYLIQENIGPLLMKYTAAELIEDGHSPQVVIRMINLHYKKLMSEEYYRYKNKSNKVLTEDDDPTKHGGEVYHDESDLVRNSGSRLEFISGLVKKLNKNTLILFNDIKGGYGKKIYDQLKTNEISAYYIDGSVDSSKRAEYKEAMERGENVALVASYGTYSTGIDLKNVFYIIFAESFKAEILIRQSIGRGMRSYTNKDTIYIIDLVDWFGKYAKRHARDRIQLYREQKFVVETYNHYLEEI